MSRIQPLESGDASDKEVKQRLTAAENGWYGDAAFFGAMAHTPVIFTHLYDTLSVFPSNKQITTELLELMRLRIATVHECAYCATVRTLDVRNEIVGREDAVLGGEINSNQLTYEEELAVTLADHLASNPHRITDELIDTLHETFSETETIELLLFASLEVGLDRFCIALELDTTDASSYPSSLNYPHNERIIE